MTLILALAVRLTKGRLEVSGLYWVAALLVDVWALRRIILKVTA